VKVTPQAIPELLLIEPAVFGDARGFFKETYHQDRYRAAGVEGTFVQDNMSRSRRGTLRGLHLQNPFAQGKLVSVLEGEVYDVAVDVRVGSPSFGKWVGMLLSAENHRQFWVPPGFAHGFCVTSESALFVYKCTDLYHPETEVGVRFDDPALQIPWPVSEPLVSDKDLKHPVLSAIDPARLPRYAGAVR
jgi:dTDP-4-dehydrorhamnose 3,5-epimerase